MASSGRWVHLGSARIASHARDVVAMPLARSSRSTAVVSNPHSGHTRSSTQVQSFSSGTIGMRRNLPMDRTRLPAVSPYPRGVTDGPLHAPVHPVRIVTAASLFDGHDAAINIMRRILQSQGCEVIHLGHNRSVHEVITAVVQEDAQGVAVSSYQGGHNEYFRYLVDELRARGLGHVRMFGGGGGVIIPSEIAELQAYGVTRIFSPRTASGSGWRAMINTIVEACDVDPVAVPLTSVDEVLAGDQGALARAITALELGRLDLPLLEQLRTAAAGRTAPVLGSPARAAPGSRRSRTSSVRGSASTRRTSSASPCSPSTPPGGAGAAPCSATASG